jgi:hypothetical protein
MIELSWLCAAVCVWVGGVTLVKVLTTLVELSDPADAEVEEPERYDTAARRPMRRHRGARLARKVRIKTLRNRKHGLAMAQWFAAERLN